MQSSLSAIDALVELDASKVDVKCVGAVLKHVQNDYEQGEEGPQHKFNLKRTLEVDTIHHHRTISIIVPYLHHNAMSIIVPSPP